MPEITVLVDNTPFANLESEHGLSFWIDYNGRHILFDTGQTDMIGRNAKKIGIDLSLTDAIILSHGHYDHTGGIPSVLKSTGKPAVYMHPRATETKYSRKPNRIKMVGMSDRVKESIDFLTLKCKIVKTEKPTEVLPGFSVTGQIPRKTTFEDTGGDFYLDQSCTVPDLVPDDQAAWFDTDNGLVVILGCAHSGVVNTLDYISSLTGRKKIHALVGGMHLVNASPERVKFTIEAIEKYGIEQIGPAHCTGSEATRKIKDAFEEKYFECHAGLKKTF